LITQIDKEGNSLKFQNSLNYPFNKKFSTNIGNEKPKNINESSGSDDFQTDEEEID
jgi:hypothetical protein